MADLDKYNSSAPGKKGSLFGLPHDRDNASLVIVPVPWDVTSQYGHGSDYGPTAILDVSHQLGLEIFGQPLAPWKKGVYMDAVSDKILKASADYRKLAEPYHKALEEGASADAYREIVDKINMASLSLNALVMKTSLDLIEKGKWVGLVGGDHTILYGLLEALSTRYDEFGILQFDAHMDLRKSYAGFTHSHASTMYNAVQLPSVKKLVQVGVRDFCTEEVLFAQDSKKVDTFYDFELREGRYIGRHWHETALDVISRLPHFVYVSIDIVGLNPGLCPGAAMPVPGGLEYNEAVYLLSQIIKSGREIIGFDLCGVTPRPDDNNWNASVGARLLYQLSAAILNQ